MFVLYLSFLAVACAAPQNYRSHFHRPRPAPFSQNEFGLDNSYFNDDIFDTRRFWSELSVELRRFDDMLQDFYKHFPTNVAEERIDGNQYRVKITLSGFEEKDIVVKAREGLLVIQAVHKNEYGSEKNYLDIRTLPKSVNITGTWTYENGILEVIFPVDTVTESTTESDPVTEEPKSREEIDPEGTESAINVDIDDTNRGDQNNEVDSNAILRQKVEATTYAVDLNDDVELVPFRY